MSGDLKSTSLGHWISDVPLDMSWMSLWYPLCCSWNILSYVYCILFFVFRGSSSLPSCLELKWRGGVSASRGGIHCPVKEHGGLTGRPCFLVCSCGQGEETIPRVPEQQPLGHRGRGCAGAGGAGDCHHPLLEALPHGQAGLSAWHRGQRSAASEGKGWPLHPHVHMNVLWAGLGRVWAPGTEGRGEGLVRKSSGPTGGVPSLLCLFAESLVFCSVQYLPRKRSCVKTQ